MTIRFDETKCGGLALKAMAEISELIASEIVPTHGVPSTAFSLMLLAAEMYRHMPVQYSPMEREEFIHQAKSVWAITGNPGLEFVKSGGSLTAWVDDEDAP